MSICIVHLGMHKTGSSSIQNSLYHGLRDPAFHYVDLGQPNASAALVSAFRADPEMQNMARKRGLSRERAVTQAQQTLDRLQAQLALHPERTAILSAEHLLTRPQDELAALFGFLRSERAEIRALAYVRPPRSYMESVFQQHVQGGSQRWEVSRFFPHYRKRFEKFEQLLGRESVQYRYFDPATFADGCVVRDFCTALGIELSASAVQRVNESLSLPAVRLLYAYRRLGPGYGTGDLAVQQNAALVRRLRTLAGPRLHFHSQLSAPLIAENAEAIAWMEARLERSLAEPPVAAPGAIGSLEELLDFEPQTLHWLASQLGPEHLARCGGSLDATTVAAWMHELRFRGSDTRSQDNPRQVARRLLRRLGARLSGQG